MFVQIFLSILHKYKFYKQVLKERIYANSKIRRDDEGWDALWSSY
jgi:hypothetical protein